MQLRKLYILFGNQKLRSGICWNLTRLFPIEFLQNLLQFDTALRIWSSVTLTVKLKLETNVAYRISPV